MIDGNITEFIDLLYYGQELVFLYEEKKYFLQGWWSEDENEATMVLENINEKPFSGYIWEYHADKMSKCAEAFLAAPIWDGKDFLQIEANVTWTDW